MSTHVGSTQYSPTDEQVLSLASEIRDTSPSIGISKLLSALKSHEPTWTLSEKRLKKILSKPQTITSSSTAISRLTPQLAVPVGLEVKTTPTTGKGLYSTSKIGKGDLLFKESPFVWVPGPEVWKLPIHGHCSFCGKVFGNIGASLRVNCKECKQVWCNKACAKKDIAHSTEHKFLTCPKQNIGWHAYLDYAVRLQEWHGALAMGYLWTRLICHASPTVRGTELAGTSTFAETLASFSTISQEKRHENLPSWIFEEESVRDMWTRSYKILMTCLRSHPQFQQVEKFLTFEQFLLHLGMYNTNNLNGGLFLLHSHLNHSCAPNARVIDVRGRAAELSVVAKEDIAQGEEVTISYVDPSWPGELRRETLKRNYGFDCHCRLCLADLSSTR